MRTDLLVLVASLGVVSVACSSSSSTPGSSSSGSSGSGSSSGSSTSSGSSSGGASGSSTSSGSSVSGGTSSGSSGSGSSGGSGSSSGSGTGSSGSSSGSSGDAGTSPGPDGSTTLAAYPSGPYCSPAGSNGHLAVGCVLPNTSWIGYDDEAANELATMEPYAPYSLGDVFANAQKTGKRYAMLNLADFSCPGCAESGAVLSEVNDAGVSAGAAVVQAGGVVIELLEAVNFAYVPTHMQLDTWVNDPTLAVIGGVYPHALNVTSVEDPNPGTGTTPAPSLAFFGRRDQAYIIDLTTMKILQYKSGNIGPTANGTGNSSYQAMEAMHQLLGK